MCSRPRPFSEDVQPHLHLRSAVWSAGAAQQELYGEAAMIDGRDAEPAGGAGGSAGLTKPL